MNPFEFNFQPTKAFLLDASKLVSEFEYNIGFYSNSTSTAGYAGDGANKMFLSSSVDLISAKEGTLPDALVLSPLLGPLTKITGKSPTVGTEDLVFGGDSSDNIDGLFLYTGTQVAFFAPIEPRKSIEDLADAEDSLLEFYPSKEFALSQTKENLFNTITDYYYLAYSSDSLDMIADAFDNNSNVSIFDSEVTLPNVDEGQPLARGNMSTAELIFNESAASIVLSFSNILHTGGIEDTPVQSAFIVKKSKDTNSEQIEKVIFESDIIGPDSDRNEVIVRGARYSGEVSLQMNWIVII